jgi:hypothetical protein
MNEEINLTRALIGIAAYLVIVIIGLVMYVVSRRQGE